MRILMRDAHFPIVDMSTFVTTVPTTLHHTAITRKYSVLIPQFGSQCPSRSLGHFFLSAIFRTWLWEKLLYLLLCCIDLYYINMLRIMYKIDYNLLYNINNLSICIHSFVIPDVLLEPMHLQDKKSAPYSQWLQQWQAIFTPISLFNNIPLAACVIHTPLILDAWLHRLTHHPTKT